MNMDKYKDHYECYQCPNVFIQEIINERKGESKRKAEEKRLLGLTQIQERNLMRGGSPLNLFPNEIWVKILKEGTLSPRDRYNVREAHPVFRELIEHAYATSQVQHILLPMVMDRKIPFLERLLKPRPGVLDIRGYIRVLRKVCKSVRDAVDQWLEDDLLLSMRNSSSPSFNPNSNDFKFFGFTDNARKLESVLAFSRGPLEERPSKFYLRSLEICFASFYYNSSTPHPHTDWFREELFPQRKSQYLRNFTNFTDHISELLTSIGDQILHFKFLVAGMKIMHEDLGVAVSRIYAILREWLMLMPNLKCLELSSDMEDIGGLDGVIEDLQMPSIASLEKITIRSCENGDFLNQQRPVWDNVLTANPHVRYFTRRGLNHDFRDDATFTTPAVLSLALEEVQCGSRDRQSDLPFLWKIGDSSWKLKKLDLWLNVQFQSIEDVFRSLEKFPTLEDLSLHLSNVKIGGEICYLRLPNLKHFQLEFCHFIPWKQCTGKLHFFLSLHFLIFCEKLESLTANWNALLSWPSQIKPWSESNGWDLFPFLACIEEKYEGGGVKFYRFDSRQKTALKSHWRHLYPNLE